MTNAFRARADELGTARSAARFRSGTSLAEGAELNRVVAQAVARAKTGDQEAFRFLYLRYADNVYGYVKSIVRDEFEAEDVTQHVFTKLITTLPKYEQREVIVLRHVVGLSPGEIAGRLGKTEPSVHGLHHRGRGALRAVLTERDCAPTVKTKLAA